MAKIKKIKPLINRGNYCYDVDEPEARVPGTHWTRPDTVGLPDDALSNWGVLETLQCNSQDIYQRWSNNKNEVYTRYCGSSTVNATWHKQSAGSIMGGDNMLLCNEIQLRERREAA